MSVRAAAASPRCSDANATHVYEQHTHIQLTLKKDVVKGHSSMQQRVRAVAMKELEALSSLGHPAQSIAVAVEPCTLLFRLLYHRPVDEVAQAASACVLDHVDGRRLKVSNRGASRVDTQALYDVPV